MGPDSGCDSRELVYYVYMPPTLEETRANLLSPVEATQYLPYSQTHILDLARKGQLPCIKIGRKVFFKKDELAAILDKGLLKQVPVIATKEQSVNG